jgi:hypothetical protein
LTNQLRPLNVSSFRGGLNLRADAFQLADDESPYLLNVDVDPVGGVSSRKGWERWTTGGEVSIATWDPRSLFVWERSDGTLRPIMSVNTEIHVTTVAGTFARLGTRVGEADPHGCDFVPWGDTLYIIEGKGRSTIKWDGVSTSSSTLLTQSAAANFNDDYTAPVGGKAPKAELGCAHLNYLFLAYTQEDGTNYPNRIRWSHPNQPEDWASDDYIDITDGGAKITAIVSIADHLLIFKPNSIWALFGYDADSFNLVNVTRNLGALNRQVVVQNGSSVFFLSWPHGVFEYSPGEGVKELSGQLRPAFEDGRIAAAYITKSWLGWMNRKLWFSCPFAFDGSATDADAIFVYDPTLQSWVLYQDGNGKGLGPFGETTGNSALACHRVSKHVVSVDANEEPTDDITGSEVDFPTTYATKWLDAGWPTLKKSWKRPDYVVSEQDAEYDLTVEVYKDYDESEPKSQHTVVVDTGGSAVWGSGTWGTGTWEGSPMGSRVERGGAIGLARSIQLRFNGELGLPWALGAMVAKYRPRKFR